MILINCSLMEISERNIQFVNRKNITKYNYRIYIEKCIFRLLRRDFFTATAARSAGHSLWESLGGITYGWNRFVLHLRFRNRSKAFTHGFLATDHNAVSIMYHPVTDRIGNQGISDPVALSGNVELGAQDGRSFL